MSTGHPETPDVAPRSTSAVVKRLESILALCGWAAPEIIAKDALDVIRRLEAENAAARAVAKRLADTAVTWVPFVEARPPSYPAQVWVACDPGDGTRLYGDERDFEPMSIEEANFLRSVDE